MPLGKKNHLRFSYRLVQLHVNYMYIVNNNVRIQKGKHLPFSTRFGYIEA